jgi:putative secretion ATPase (PEP-CTERM system associated)
MYLEYFNLKEHPFQLTPDSDFLYMSESHARAKAYMDYTIWNRDGFVVVSGEVGSGKTTLIQKLLSEFDENILVAKIFQTQLDEVEFLQAVLVEFGLNPFNAKKVELLDMLSTFLIESFLQSKQLILIVDEAQNLSKKVLEEIRLLSGLETQKEKILHVILVGQPELNNLLDSSDMEQLAQRVRLRCHISALSQEEMIHYIAHRLSVAGANNPGLFQPDAIALIYAYSGGIPRLINTLCDTALTCAFTDDQATVSAAVVKTAIQELQWLPYTERMKARAERRPAAADPHSKTSLVELLDSNRRCLTSLADKLERLEPSASALGEIVRRMQNIEKILQRIAGAEQDKGDKKHTKNKHGASTSP